MPITKNVDKTQVDVDQAFIYTVQFSFGNCLEYGKVVTIKEFFPTNILFIDPIQSEFGVIKSINKKETQDGTEVTYNLGNNYGQISGSFDIVCKFADGVLEDNVFINKAILYLDDVEAGYTISPPVMLNLEDSIIYSDKSGEDTIGKKDKEEIKSPPKILAKKRFLFVGDDFDPLDMIVVKDYDGSDITSDVEVMKSLVDTSKIGVYEVSYRVISKRTELSRSETIFVTVLEKNSCYQPITDLVESIALQQTAISHIINAEGEKMQKALQLGLVNEQLLEMNKSVTDVIDSITALEMVLHSKLSLVEMDVDACKWQSVK